MMHKHRRGGRYSERIVALVGREMRDSDTSSSSRVAVVNQTLAEGYFKDANALMRSAIT
jgi:hypothetical protein